jgi:4-amino-4-deoxy-L-arabinose transferase-like glycosyltransferase
VLLVTRHSTFHLYDAFWYDFQAAALSGGHFFPVVLGTAPDAAHPPLTSLVLVPSTWVFGLHPGETAQRLTMAVLGAGVVAAVGVLGRTVAGPRAGLLSAALSALYPNMWMPSGIVMSETPAMLVVTLTVLAAYRMGRDPSWGNAALVGMGCGADMLTRAESVLLVPLLLLPATLGRARSWRRAVALAGAGVLSAGIVIGPWVGRNLVSFRDTTFLSTGAGAVVAGANCPVTYSGAALGSWSPTCAAAVKSPGDQSVASAQAFDAALHYARHHLGRVPVVLLARAGRVWDLYAPIRTVELEANEGRPTWASLAGLAVYYALVPLAVVGGLALRRRRIRQWPLLVPAVMVTLVALAAYGDMRLRAEFEPSLVVLAATGVLALGRVPMAPLAPRTGRPAAAGAEPPG